MTILPLHTGGVLCKTGPYVIGQPRNPVGQQSSAYAHRSEVIHRAAIHPFVQNLTTHTTRGPVLLGTAGQRGKTSCPRRKNATYAFFLDHSTSERMRTHAVWPDSVQADIWSLTGCDPATKHGLPWYATQGRFITLSLHTRGN